MHSCPTSTLLGQEKLDSDKLLRGVVVENLELVRILHCCADLLVKLVRSVNFKKKVIIMIIW